MALTKYILKGIGTSVDEKTRKTIEDIVGHVRTDNDTDGKRPAGAIYFDDPLAVVTMIGKHPDMITEYLKKFSRVMENKSQDGFTFESYAWNLFPKLYGDWEALGTHFHIPKAWEHLKDIPVRIVATYIRRDRWIAVSVGPRCGPGPQLGFQAESSVALRETLKSCGGLTMYLPDKLHHSDGFALWQVKGCPHKFIGQVQVKANTTITPGILQTAVRSLEPEGHYKKNSDPVRIHFTCAGSDLFSDVGVRRPACTGWNGPVDEQRA